MNIAHKLTTVILISLSAVLLTTVGNINTASATVQASASAQRAISCKPTTNARYYSPNGTYSYVPPPGFRANARTARRIKTATGIRAEGGWDGPYQSTIATGSYPQKPYTTEAALLRDVKKFFVKSYPRNKMLLARSFTKGKYSATLVVAEYTDRHFKNPVRRVIQVSIQSGNRIYLFACFTDRSTFSRIGKQFNTSIGTITFK